MARPGPWSPSCGSDVALASRAVAIARGLAATAVLASALLFGLAACVSVSFKATGAASAEDLQAENAYVAAYMQHMTRFATDLREDPGAIHLASSSSGHARGPVQTLDHERGSRLAMLQQRARWLRLPAIGGLIGITTVVGFLRLIRRGSPGRRPTGDELMRMTDAEFADFIGASGIRTVTTAGLGRDGSAG